MSWTRATLPAPLVNTGLNGVWFGVGINRWLINETNQFAVTLTSDFVTFTTTNLLPLGLDMVDAAAFDGQRWVMVGELSTGLYRSTDGATGAAWQRITPDFSGGSGVSRARQVFATPTGRLLARYVRDFQGRISYSDDGGVTWVETAALLDPTAENRTISSGFCMLGDGGVAVLDVGNRFMASSDNGVTWNALTPTTIGEITGGVARVGTTWLAANRRTSARLSVSTNNGATWAALNALPQDVWRLRQASNGVVYAHAENYPGPNMWFSSNLVDWTPVTTAGLPPYLWASSTDFNAEGARLVLDGAGGDSSADAGVYTIASPGFVPPPPPPPPPPAGIGLPLRLTVQAAPGIVLPVRLQVGEVRQTVLPVRLQVLTPSVLAGLDGAGGWPAAPDGQWRPVVLLGGVDVSDRLVGECVVGHADNTARVAEFALRPVGVLAPMALIGARVQVALARRGPAGEALDAQTLFTGVVETPTLDVQTGLVRCVCFDQMQEVFANTPRAWIDANVGGRWRVEVSGEPRDNWDYLEARRASVPVSVALDALQQPRVLPWRGLPVVTVRDADVLDGAPVVTLPSRADVRTRVTVRLQYRFSRLRARGVVASYSQPREFYTGYVGFGGEAAVRTKQFLTTAMVESAVEGLRGWTLQSLSLDRSAPGNYPLGPVLSDGVFELQPEVAPTLVWGFTARYQARWVQTVTEEVRLTVRLPALEAALGVVNEPLAAAVTQPFEAADWVGGVRSEPALAVTVGDVAQDWEPDPAARDEVLRTLLDQAWVRLWDSSRTGRVRLTVPLRPSLWLDTDMRVEMTRLRAQGKVVAVEHRLNVDTGEAVTAVEVAVGLPGQADAVLPSWTVPGREPFVPVADPAALAFEIGTFVGGRDNSAPWNEANVGFSTNLINPMAGAEHFYPHQLSIGSPEVVAADRDPVAVEQEGTLDVAVPTDTLEWLP